MDVIATVDIFRLVGLFLLLAGFVIGLGAVTVIDVHGWLARQSAYWTEATIRSHKVTKPLIWLGISLAVVGGFIFYRGAPLVGIPLIHLVVAAVLILNGCFLSFSVSPYLLDREENGKAKEPLPLRWQRRIMTSMIISDIGWWGSLLLLAIYLLY